MTRNLIDPSTYSWSPWLPAPGYLSRVFVTKGKYKAAVLKAADQYSVKRVLKDPPDIEVLSVRV